MKKTIKTPKTPAPATKLTAPTPARKSTVAPKIVKSAAPSPASPVVVAKPRASNVTISANIDVGFGNALFVRGDEPFLSWNKGVALGCVSSGKWETVLTGIDRPFQFKFTRNDTDWSVGANYTASPGDTVTLTPAF